MIPENRIPTHPGEVLLEEYLRPLGMSQAAFARHIGVPPQHINEIVRQKRAVTPELAWRLAQALGTSPEFGSIYRQHMTWQPGSPNAPSPD